MQYQYNHGNLHRLNDMVRSGHKPAVFWLHVVQRQFHVMTGFSIFIPLMFAFLCFLPLPLSL